MVHPHTVDEIASGLRGLGIGDGDAVVIHSSLRALGPVAGGADGVVRALIEAVGPRGLILVPTYTYFGDRFDPRTEPSRTGQLTETIRTWPGTHRSWHPTHSVAALGDGAVELVRGHHLIAACGHGSPLDKMAARDGWVLLIGVSHTANSTIHVGEVHAAVPYLDVPFFADSPTEATVVTPSGEVRVPILHPSGCSRAFGAVERPLRTKGAIRDGILGNALVQLMRGRVLIETVVDMLTADPGELLCSDPACHRCTESRKTIAAAQGAA